MKKLFPVAAFAVFAMMFTSCKKDYTCTCTITVTGTNTSTTQPISLGKMTKKDAQSKCDQAKATYTTAATTASCSI